MVLEPANSGAGRTNVQHETLARTVLFKVRGYKVDPK